MNKPRRVPLAVASLCATLFLSAAVSAAPSQVAQLAQLADQVGANALHAAVCAEGHWIGKSADNICGLRDARTVSNPGKVDFGKLMNATPEIKKIEKDGIDRSSPEGIQLMQKAVDRVTKACKAVMAEKGHCSVWKKIEHSEGRTASDLTDAVEAKL